MWVRLKEIVSLVCLDFLILTSRATTTNSISSNKNKSNLLIKEMYNSYSIGRPWTKT